MSGLKGITVNTAPEAEAHILAEDDAAIYQAIIGEDGVFDIGQKLKATVESNNLITIADGVLWVGGHFARVRVGDKIECPIANGEVSKKRNDLIVAKFETTNGIDGMSIEIVEGIAGSTASDPEVSNDDLYNGGLFRNFPLYRVKIEGLSIVAVEPLFETMPCISELKQEIITLKNKIPFSKSSIGFITLSFWDDNWLGGEVVLDEEYSSNAKIFVSLQYIYGTALNSSNFPILSSVVKGNKLTVWASGNFANGHLVTAAYFIVE